MKNKFIILIAFLGMLSFIACEKDEDKVIIGDSPSIPTLGTLPSFDNFNLDNSAEELTFTWSAPDFGFSAYVTYSLELDSMTKGFENPIRVYTGDALETKITISDLNKLLVEAGYEEYDVNLDMIMRVKSTIGTSVEPVYSSITDLVIAPFATAFPPIYMTGAATGGWNWDGSQVEMRSSAPKVYQTIANFLNGEAFRFFAQQDWGPTSYNFPYFSAGTVAPEFEDALDGDNNFRFIGTTGYFDITCDLKNFNVTMEAVDEPVMFMTGAAIGGWNWGADYVQMTWISNGIFETTTEFINGEAFRFFAQADWGPTSYNYPYFANGEVDALFEDAGDGDNNFRFVGTTGNYKVTLNMLDNIVTMEAAK